MRSMAIMVVLAELPTWDKWYDLELDVLLLTEEGRSKHMFSFSAISVYQ